MERLEAVFNLRWGRPALLGLAVGIMLLATVAAVSEVRQEAPVTLQVLPASDPNQIRVYVGGAVEAPGVYDLPRGSRIAEAIAAAGGATDVGDTSVLGMAAVVHDSDQLIVPIRRAIAPTATSAVLPAVAAGTTQPNAPTTVPSPIPADTNPAPVSSTGALINVNTASIDELDTLPGIGPVLAQRIIDHRVTNGPFQSLDDLDVIKGISPRMVEEMRPLATTVS